MLLTLYRRSFIKIHKLFSVIPCGVPLPHSNTLQYYVKGEKCKVNDAIFLSGCEAHAINLGNKNMKIGIFTGVTSLKIEKYFSGISRYPTGKHEINNYTLFIASLLPIYSLLYDLIIILLSAPDGYIVPPIMTEKNCI